MVQSVELLFDEESDAAIREQWAALEAAGLPSQSRHLHSSNRPHVTVGVAAAIPAPVESGLSELAELLPLRCTIDGPVVFAAGAEILVRGIDPSPGLLALHARAAELMRSCPGVPATLTVGHWTPHVTLARRLRPEQTRAAGQLLDLAPLRGYFVAVRRWDGDARKEWLLAPG